MTDLTYLDPPVELLATSPRQEMLSNRMRTHGLRPIAVGETWTEHSRVPLLVDIASMSTTTLERLEQAVRAGIDRTVILLSRQAPAGIDLTTASTSSPTRTSPPFPHDLNCAAAVKPGRAKPRSATTRPASSAASVNGAPLATQ